MANNRLTRSDDSMFLGVAAGLAEYTNLDPTLIRLMFVLFTLAGGPGLIAYVILALVMPKASEGRFEEDIIIEKEAA